MTQLPHGFAFGSCRMRFMPCRYCTTVLSSLAQVEYWLDVIEGKRSVPVGDELLELLCYEQAQSEPWRYDFSDVRCVLVEVCTVKTLWYTDDAGEHYPLSLLGNHRKQETLDVPTELFVATPDELYSEMLHLRNRLKDKFVVFVCQQVCKADNFSLYWATAEIRTAIMELVFRAAAEMPNCAAYDPTPRIATNPSEYLLDIHHWTANGGKVLAEDLAQLVPEEYR